MRTASFLITLLLQGTVLAQTGRTVLRTDSGTVVIHHFEHGAVSSKEWMDKDSLWGRSWAYDAEGRVIFGHNTRNIHGRSSVHFTYHASGGVRTADVVDEPESGTQSYRSTTTFDPTGKRTGFTEVGNDTFSERPRPGMRRLVDVEPLTGADTIAGSGLINEVYVVNGSGRPCDVVMEPRTADRSLGNAAFPLQHGDTMYVGHYRSTGDFRSPVDLIRISGTMIGRNAKKQKVPVLMMQKKQLSPRHRIYYYRVSPYGGGYGISF